MGTNTLKYNVMVKILDLIGSFEQFNTIEEFFKFRDKHSFKWYYLDCKQLWLRYELV